MLTKYFCKRFIVNPKGREHIENIYDVKLYWNFYLAYIIHTQEGIKFCPVLFTRNKHVCSLISFHDTHCPTAHNRKGNANEMPSSINIFI
jgi:hypothetical protein